MQTDKWNETEEGKKIENFEFGQLVEFGIWGGQNVNCMNIRAFKWSPRPSWSRWLSEWSQLITEKGDFG